MYMCIHTHRPEEGVRSLGARFIGICELPDIGTGDQTRPLHEHYTAVPFLQPLHHLRRSVSLSPGLIHLVKLVIQ